MPPPTVAVVVSCFNLGEFLQEAIDSVLAQTFQDFEIVVMDDGSTDTATREVLDALRTPQTRVIRTPNRGLTAARNVGIRETTGRYICALDADDRLEPTLFEKSVAALEADPSVMFVSHWLRTFGDEASEWTPARCDFPTLLDTNTVNGAALVRREALEAVGGFDETMRDGCEDWDLWITLVERGFRGAILPEFLFQNRRRAGSMSRIMTEGGGHPRLYEALARKHEQSYQQHVAALVARRDEDIATLNRQIHDLDAEHQRWLQPELSKVRDDLEMFRRREEQPALRVALDEAATTIATLRRQLAERETERTQLAELITFVHDKRVRLRKALDSAAVERARLDAELAQQAFAYELAAHRALELGAVADRLVAQLTQLRMSMSWRLTGPFRAIYGGLTNLIQGREK